jgi:RecJ-like exonuclease
MGKRKRSKRLFSADYCDECKGRGYDPATYETCYVCEGQTASYKKSKKKKSNYDEE